MVCTHFCRVDHETGREEPSRLEASVWEKVVPFEDVCGELKLAMHNVTYKTELLKQNGFAVDNGFYTDCEYLLFPIPWVKTAAFLDRTVYMYRVSLSTQSMSIGSLQKNVLMHRGVVMRLADCYAAYEQSGSAQPNTAAFMRTVISGITGMQLTIYLSYPDTKRYREETKRMMEELRGKSEALYAWILRTKSFRLLQLSGYAVFPLLSAYHKKHTFSS